MKKINATILYLFLVVTTLITSCKHDPQNIDQNDPSTIDPPIDTLACDSSNVSYPGIVQPILEAYCINCHSGPSPSGALDFDDYEDVAFIAQSGQLLGALKHLEGFEPMPPDQSKISNCEIALIEKWINDTTFVIPPDTTECDTSNITYADVVYPIFEANCITCHGPPSPASGIDLTNYDQVSFIAQSGQLLGSINHEAGYTPMPDNAPPLSDCEKLQIAKWVNDTTFTPGGGGGIPCDPDTAYFQNDVLPLLISSCGLAGCHDEGSAQDGIILTSYYYVMQTADIVPGEPWESDIIEVINETDPDDRMPPPPTPPLTQDQKDLIYNWIAQGALNNYCEVEDCDSVNVTFSNQVFPIIQNSCYGCHSGSDPSGGISLTNYNEIVAAGSVAPGNPGSLLGSITWANGNTPMPQNGPPLSDCDIAQIRKWINDGMPDN
jgi:mono/diheme cytochrome c family protein